MGHMVGLVAVPLIQAEERQTQSQPHVLYQMTMQGHLMHLMDKIVFTFIIH